MHFEDGVTQDGEQEEQRGCSRVGGTKKRTRNEEKVRKIR
jgi:hypothetical protein